MPRRSGLLSLAPGAARRRRELADTSAIRRRLLPSRCVMVSLIAGLMHLGLGWGWAWVWAGLFVLALYGETLAARRVLSQPTISRRAFYGMLAIYFVVGAMYSGIAVPVWLHGDANARVCAALMLTGVLVNLSVASRASGAAFLASSTPSIAVFLAVPVYLLSIGQGGGMEVVILVAVALIVGQTTIAARELRRSQRAEAAARSELDRRRCDAEAATAAKSAFVAVVSHELRTPISGVLAAAGEMQRLSRDPQQAECAALVADSARFMQTVLNDLLDMAKLEAGRMSVEETAFDLGLLLHETGRFWSIEAGKRGVPLRMESAFGLPGRVSGDPTRVRQILNNLLSNALKFTGPDGVTWSADAGPVQQGRSTLTIRVIDTGSGIPAEKLDRLFTPFEQADVTIARTHGGTGLGLAISRELARLMGGDLKAENGPARGAVFELTLPLVALPNVSESAHPAANVSAAPSSLRVLVVDDHEINRRTLALLLEPLGCDVIFAADGREALALSASEAFDVILMDVMMPELDGRETTRRLRSGHGVNRCTPVIAVSGGDSQEEINACLDAGMNACVAKPVTPEALYTAIYACASGAASDAPGLALAG